MLAGTKHGLALFTKWRGSLRLSQHIGRRNKSEPARQVDDFPYKSLNHHDAYHMSAEMESTTKLPLRSFFAQHRPLMPFGRPAGPDEGQNFDNRWVHIPVNNGRFPIFMSDDRPMWNVIPEDVAKKIGPFNRNAVMSTKWADFKNSSNEASLSSSSYGSSAAPLSASEMQSVLSKRFPILMEHLQKMTGGDGEVRVIPLTVEKVLTDDVDGHESVEATSVRRKRKLKMNRHKYRKRLKEQRTKRRRLGK